MQTNLILRQINNPEVKIELRRFGIEKSVRGCSDNRSI